MTLLTKGTQLPVSPWGENTSPLLIGQSIRQDLRACRFLLRCLDLLQLLGILLSRTQPQKGGMNGTTTHFTEISDGQCVIV